MKKILWITNNEPSYAAKYFGRTNYSGGWIDLSSKLLAKTEGYDLYILAMGHNYDEIRIDGIHCCGFDMHEANIRVRTVIGQYEPDIIHVWGTEFEHFLVVMELVREMKKTDITVVSIQGLVSEIANYSWFMLPEAVVKRKTLYEMYIHNTIKDTKKYYTSHGDLERLGLNIAKHCIGRSDWDRAMVRQYNRNIKYHKCNETLRQAFYDNQWDISSCEKHSIVFSQSNYMIKGAHIMIEALAIVREFYPDVKLYALGESPFKRKTVKEWIKRSSYMEYLGELIEKKNLRSNIEFLGSLDEQRMVKHYLRGNVFVCASAIENSSNSIGEAMVLGMPIVASDVGGVKSFITHEQNGLLYQANSVRMLADCVMRIFDNPTFGVKLAKGAKTAAENIYNYSQNNLQLCDIYEKLLANNDECII